LDTQHIITHEANIPLVADPLGGSYYLEWLTDKMEKDAYEYMAEIEERGGIFECLDSGWLNSIMEQNRLKLQREKAEGKRLIIGVNSFQGEEGPINKAVRGNAYKVPTEKLRQERVEEVIAFKNSRDYTKVKQTIKQLYLDTKENRNISRAVVEAAKAGVTIGEFTGVVRLAYNLNYDPMNQIDAPEFIKDVIEECK
jgi:methylmalonyl-CoA mutase N-terminal domain/subunit